MNLFSKHGVLLIYFSLCQREIHPVQDDISGIVSDVFKSFLYSTYDF